MTRSTGAADSPRTTGVGLESRAGSQERWLTFLKSGRNHPPRVRPALPAMSSTHTQDSPLQSEMPASNRVTSRRVMPVIPKV